MSMTMTLQSTPPKEDSKSFLKTLKKTTAMALLSVSTLALSTSYVQASLGAGAGEAAEQAPSAKLLAQWDGKITEARKAFTPLIQTLKLLADPEFRAAVELEKGANFATYEKETVANAWAQKTIVVAFLKELYGAHTELIPRYFATFDLLSKAQAALLSEQGVSADLRKDLQAAGERIESLQVEAQSVPAPSAVDAAALAEAQRLLAAEQEKTADLEERVRQMPTINGGAGDDRDVEEGLRPTPSAASPLLGNSANPVSSSKSWRTTVLFTAGGTVIGVGLGALFTWLFLSHKA